MEKWALSTLCFLVLCLGLLPATARAAGPTVLRVGDQMFNTAQNAYWDTDENGHLVSSTDETYHIRYDADTTTLYLNGTTIAGSGSYGAAIYAQGDLTISLSDTNRVTGSNFDSDSYAICLMDGTLTITGDGTLEARGGTASSISQGVYLYSTVDLTVEGTGTLMASSISQAPAGNGNWFIYGGDSGSSGGDSGDSGSQTVTNPDGSTTTVTDKTSGTVTEATKNPDGSQQVMETQKGGTNMEQALTWEQMATMLWRYAGQPAGSVSDWAVQAMAWAVEGGLINGVGANTLAPQDTATRTQLATILMRSLLNA